jgi:inhibitor of KinA
LRLEPLGDQAVMAYCDDENQATLLAGLVRAAPPSWCVDVVQAYVSVAVFYDSLTIDFAHASSWLTTHREKYSARSSDKSRLHIIPCCYELGLDFERIGRYSGLNHDDIIRIHGGQAYTIYAIGFCPGFPYLGYLPKELAGVPRLETPRLKVEQGSVGLTGRQTGIYTEARPGGWNIIGRTPLQLVDVRDEYFPLKTGDRVEFRRIDEREYQAVRGNRLPLVA